MKCLGSTPGRCDATLTFGPVKLYDPEIQGQPHVLVRLSEPSAQRLEDGLLFPREWVRLSLRMSPHHMYLNETNYDDFGRAYDSLPEQRVVPEELAFPSADEVCLSCVEWATLAIIWSGSDVDRTLFNGKDGLGVSMSMIARSFRAEEIYATMDHLSEMSRCVEDVIDSCHEVATECLEHPDIAWVRERWRVYGKEHSAFLVKLSAKCMSAESIAAEFMTSVEQLPSERIRWERFACTEVARLLSTQYRAAFCAQFISLSDVEGRQIITEHLRQQGLV